MKAESRTILPHEAEIIERTDEGHYIYTLRLRFTDPVMHQAYSFEPGQFNMLYLPGVGEVPISIVSDPEDDHLYDHTIRAVGRVTRALMRLKKGDRIGVRGPFGRGWPMAEAKGKDVLIATGGLGCAPVVSVINYILRRRAEFGRLTILQGVKHADELIWRERYEAWAKLPDTRVLLTADKGAQGWPFRSGLITACLDEVELQPDRTLAMMCGPPGMMAAVASDLQKRGMSADRLYLSMERNMQCGIGKCGHCQIGGRFCCRDGPVFTFEEMTPLMSVPGF